MSSKARLALNRYRLPILATTACFLAAILVIQQTQGATPAKTVAANTEAKPGNLAALLPQALQQPQQTIIPLTTPDAEGIRTIPDEEPEHEGIRECKRRMHEATTEEAKQAVVKWCWDQGKKQSAGYIDADPRLANVSASTAKNWWPYPNPLHNPNPNPKLTQHIYITANQQKPIDPTTADYSSIDILYTPPDAPPTENTYQQTITAGGIWIHNQHHQGQQKPNGPQTITTRPTTVQNHPATITEIRPDGPTTPTNGQIKGDANIRVISWLQTQPDTSTLTWLIITDLNKYTEQQTINIANQLENL